MKTYNFIFAALTTVYFTESFAQAATVPAANVSPTQAYGETKVQAELKIAVDKNIEKVHFIRDNSDPYVITKAYVLKHASAFELRPYIRSLATSNKVKENTTGVDCIVYNDGTNILLVSAEDYRFETSDNGMGIDDIIKFLDRPKITSSSGSKALYYFPIYRSASQLAEMVANVGAVTKHDEIEFYGQGQDKLYADTDLNMLYCYTPAYSQKNIIETLKKYDKPLPMARIKYTVYELYAENDGKLGLDFQSWKNNEGADVFQAGLNYRNNWAATWKGGMVNTKNNNTKFLNFNPKWNTRYLDFLVSKGKGKIFTAGSILIRNGKKASIVRKTSIFTVKSKNNEKNIVMNQYQTLKYTGSGSLNNIKAYNEDNKLISIAGSGKADVIIVRGPYIEGSNDSDMYKIILKNIDGEVYFTENSRKSSDSDLYATHISGLGSWNDDIELKYSSKSKMYQTEKADGFGFEMNITPTINTTASTFSVNIENTSLIGWNADGSPRLSNSNVNTKIQISNTKNKFIIGGIGKSNIVRSVSGQPFLRELPVIGFLFSSESESTKKSRMVVVAEVERIDPRSTIPATVKPQINKATNATVNAGEDNSYGFDQYLLDK